MRNLFICHTQAQLILASGLVCGRFKEDDNDLILFVDFGITQTQKERLKKTFSRVLFLQSIYPAEFNTLWAKLKWYPKDWKEIRRFVYCKFDRVFAVCDWLLLVQKTLKRAHHLNPAAEITWLEDGITSYYSDSDIRGGFDCSGIARTLRRLLFRDILGVGSFYDRDFRETGGLKCFGAMYTCYPQSVRDPYKSHRKLIAITDREYRAGLESMYVASELNLIFPLVIIVADKLDRYEYPEMVKDSLSKLIEESRRNGRTVVCKFHPRESMRWDIFDDCYTLDNSIGIESTYLSLHSHKEDVTIVGIKSTGLMSAKKLGFNTISLFPSCGEENKNLTAFYQSLGVKLI